MSGEPEAPFDSLESAQQFVELLVEAVEEARQEITEQIAAAPAADAQRRKQALQLISYNLGKLATHLATSRQILNDLRSLRQLLLPEKPLEKEAEE